MKKNKKQQRRKRKNWGVESEFGSLAVQFIELEQEAAIRLNSITLFSCFPDPLFRPWFSALSDNKNLQLYRIFFQKSSDRIPQISSNFVKNSSHFESPFLNNKIEILLRMFMTVDNITFYIFFSPVKPQKANEK